MAVIRRPLHAPQLAVGGQRGEGQEREGEEKGRTEEGRGEEVRREVWVE